MNRLLALLAALPLIAFAGCEDRRSISLPPPPAKPKVVTKVVAPKTTPTKTVKNKPGSRGKSGLPSAQDSQKELDIIARAHDATQNRQRNFPSNTSSGSGFSSRGNFSNSTDDAAIRKIGAVIKDSVELGPTLVVWLIDRTPSAQRSLTGVARAVQSYYESPEVKGWSQGEKLLSAVVAFDADASFVLDPPSADSVKIEGAIAGIQASTGGREMTCTAIKKALEKYHTFRGQDREVLLVVITDEAGDDRPVADEVLALARRSAIPIYVIGLPAPWGQANPQAANPKADPASADDSQPTYGPESVASERVDIYGWGGGYSAAASDMIDSGFGPYTLERICRGSRGQFITVRSGGFSGNAWPAGGAQQFDESKLSKYAPDYVSDAEYQKLLSGNKAWSALVAAAKHSKVTVEGYPESRFVKGTEAQNAKRLSQGQQFAAKNLPPVDQLYDALSPGESDRDKLTSPRLQAEFDLAMGRVCAVKARLDGYNSMIAALKRGKTFQNANSREWILEPSDTFETESTIKRMGERAKMYLERVVKEHAGTPWARIAEEELRNPMGWTWREA